MSRGKLIYVAARDDWTDGWTAEDDDDLSEHIAVDERAERLAQQEFRRKGVGVVTTEKDADFVFLVVIDPTAGKRSVLGELFPAGCVENWKTVNCASKWVAWGDSPVDVVHRFCSDALWEEP